MQAIAEQQQLKTCRLTLVTPGLPDSVLKIYPAEHEAEKVDLGTAPGEERWANIRRLMDRFVPRDQVVKKPAMLNTPPDFRTIVVKEDEIPVNTLEGAVLKALPAAEVAPQEALRLDPSVGALQVRMNQMEANIASIAQAISHLSVVNKPVAQEVTDVAVKSTESVLSVCGYCDKTFKTKSLMAMHTARFHKEAK